MQLNFQALGGVGRPESTRADRNEVPQTPRLQLGGCTGQVVMLPRGTAFPRPLRRLNCPQHYARKGVSHSYIRPEDRRRNRREIREPDGPLT